jgi:hypothetical protein
VEVESALESALCVGWGEVHLFICVSSVLVDSLPCHVGKEDSWIFRFDEAFLGVFVALPSPYYAHETQQPASAVLGPWHVVT